MRLFSTCEVCKTLLIVCDRCDPPAHPTCIGEYRPTRLDQLLTQFGTALEQCDEAQADELEAQIDAWVGRPPRLLDAALAYAAWGWPVFPLRPGQKAPLTRNGFKDATTDAGQIRRWWQGEPSANIGIPTGGCFDVIDVDVPDGVPAWNAMGGLDQEWTPGEIHIQCHGLVRTASGGWHAYITPSGGGNKARAFGVPGIDYRGTGGFVVAAPSVRADGSRWSWESKPSPVIKAGARG